MRPTLETIESINKISTALLNARIPVSAIESKSLGFYVIWYYGASVRESNDICRALEGIGASICKGESGFLASKGAFITVSL